MWKDRKWYGSLLLIRWNEIHYHGLRRGFESDDEGHDET